MTLPFDFTVDKEKLTLTVTREFAASQDLVWDAWTKAEILQLWYAPKPFRIETKEMNFTEGGRWHYAMVSAEGNKLGWTIHEFLKINPKTSYETKNFFCDENGKPAAAGFTFSITTTSFKAKGENTIVQIVKKMESLEQLEKFAATGFIQGMQATTAQLDEYLSKQTRK